MDQEEVEQATVKLREVDPGAPIARLMSEHLNCPERREISPEAPETRQRRNLEKTRQLIKELQ